MLWYYLDDIFVIEIRCPIPPLASRGVREGSSNGFGAVVEYHCDAGYRLLDGSDRMAINCTGMGTWSYTDISCEGRFSMLLFGLKAWHIHE